MKEIRLKIVEIVAQVPDNQLDGLLVYLEEMMKLTEVDSTISEHLGSIMLEDDNLLKRLAQ